MSAPIHARGRSWSERVLLEHLSLVERTATALAERSGLRGAEAEDAVSFVRLRLMENDYAVLRKFRGGSRLSTYLVTVIANLVRDYRVKLWGKWRPSATAVRLGPAAVYLERLMYRDGMPRESAILSMVSRDDMVESENELRRLAAALPPRFRIEHTSVDADILPDRAAVADPTPSSELAAQVRACLEAAIADLPPEDAVIVRLKYMNGLTLAQVARALGLEQKPLYRRLSAILNLLRTGMENRGVDADIAAEVIDSEGSGWL
jgi:RNA polymerase sigma factor (sigma-70 family)